MDYTKIEQQGSNLMLKEIKNLILPQVLDNGQSFRWSGDENNFKGIAHGRRMELSVENGDLILKDVPLKEFEETWKDYFDLNRSYDTLRQHYTQDVTLEKATAHSPGLRIMKQEPWETLVSFILSQNSNIPRIKGMIARLCEGYGEALPCGGYAFPKPEALVDADLTNIRSGYRADYIRDAARRAADGRLDFNKLSNTTSDELRQALLEIHGVGPKVADCVLLFGFGRVERFPLDVWMKRVMAEYYPNGFPVELADTAGIAQQFLFHFVRTAKDK